MIATARGPVAVEALRTGDRLVTRDNGLRRVHWIGRRDVDFSELIVEPELAPVIVRAGAFGEVCAAEWKGTPVAVKRLFFTHATDEEMDKQKQLFIDEVALLCRVRHPNVCNVLGVNVDSLFVAMDLYPSSLQQLLVEHRRSKTTVPRAKVLEVATGIAAGLTYLHDLNIIHRDVKPANVLIDDQGRVKILDMGLALVSAGNDASLTVINNENVILICVHVNNFKGCFGIYLA